MTQKGFIPLLIPVIIAVGIIGSVATHRIVTHNWIWQKYLPTLSSKNNASFSSINASSSGIANVNKASSSSLPEIENMTPSIIPSNSSNSLITITNAHLEEVRKIVPDAQLFEVGSEIVGQDIKNGKIQIPVVASYFMSAKDTSSYIGLDQLFVIPQRTNRKSYLIRKSYFHPPSPCPYIAGPISCDKTPKTEDLSFHLPIKNWHIDYLQIINILQKNNYDFSHGGALTATTLNRLRQKVFYNSRISAYSNLLKLSPEDAVIYITDSVRSTAWKPKYFILSANTGEVLEYGTTQLFFPPNPAVTSTPFPTPTSVPISPTPISNLTSQVSCQICADLVNGTCVSNKTGSAPLIISFVYAASWSNSNNDYVTNVQWDFNGDGVWDTPFDTINQHPAPFTFSQPGTYITKMHFQTKNGLESDICTASITVK